MEASSAAACLPQSFIDLCVGVIQSSDVSKRESGAAFGEEVELVEGVVVNTLKAAVSVEVFTEAITKVRQTKFENNPHVWTGIPTEQVVRVLSASMAHEAAGDIAGAAALLYVELLCAPGSLSTVWDASTARNAISCMRSHAVKASDSLNEKSRKRRRTSKEMTQHFKSGYVDGLVAGMKSLLPDRIPVYDSAPLRDHLIESLVTVFLSSTSAECGAITLDALGLLIQSKDEKQEFEASCCAFSHLLKCFTHEKVGNTEAAKRFVLSLKSPSARRAAQILLQHICLYSEQTVESRIKAVRHASSMSSALVLNDGSWIAFVAKLMKQPSVHVRTLALEVTQNMLSNCESDTTTVNEMEQKTKTEMSGWDSTCRSELLVAVRGRCSDKSANVRAKALSTLATAADTKHDDALQSWLTQPEEKLGWFDPEADGADATHFPSMLYARCSDRVAVVRKAALQLLSHRLRSTACTKTTVSLFLERSRDASPLVRKSALMGLVMSASNAMVTAAAITASLKGLLDDEPFVVESALQLVTDLLLQPCHESYCRVAELNSEQLLLMSHGVKKVAALKQRNYTKKLISSAEAEIKQSQPSDTSCHGAWHTLEMLTKAGAATPDIAWLADCWGGAGNCQGTQTPRLCALRTLIYCAETATPGQSEVLATECVHRIQMEDCSLAETTSAITLLDSLQYTPASLLPQLQALMQTLEGKLQSNEVNGMRRSVHMLGELALVKGVKLSERIIDRLLHLASMADTQVLPLLFGTLGKLCLSDQKLAQRCVPAFADQLENSPNPVVRNNVLVVLGDLCIKHTSLVDRHIKVVCAAMLDQSLLVRRQALVVLMTLLRTDFLKWHKQLLFYFACALVDKEESMRVNAEQGMLDLSISKYPSIFYAHFVEVVWVLNGLQQRKKNMNVSPQTLKHCSMPGNEASAARDRVYSTLLKHCTDEQKFTIVGRLCQEILDSVVDEHINLRQNQSIVGDTLRIISGKEIGSIAKSTHDKDEMDTETAIKTKLMSAVVKKNILQNVIPTLGSLKIFLQQKRSPLVGAVMTCLRELVMRHSAEVKDILASDRQLAKEIEFDIKRAATKKAASPTEAAAAATPRGPAAPDTMATRTPVAKVVSGCISTGKARTPGSAIRGDSATIAPVPFNMGDEADTGTENIAPDVVVGDPSKPLQKEKQRVWDVQSPIMVKQRDLAIEEPQQLRRSRRNRA